MFVFHFIEKITPLLDVIIDMLCLYYSRVDAIDRVGLHLYIICSLCCTVLWHSEGNKGYSYRVKRPVKGLYLVVYLASPLGDL